MAGTLYMVIRELHFGPRDLVVVPTADLDMLETMFDLAERWSRRGETGPLVCLRLLGAVLGEPDERIRLLRLKAIGKRSPISPRLLLTTETVEMAEHLNALLGFDVRPQFYLPCSIPLDGGPPPPRKPTSNFRIGIFGEPRAEKGSQRISQIVAATASEIERRAYNVVARHGATSKDLDPRWPDGVTVTFVLQGQQRHFESDGVYAALASVPSQKVIEIERHTESLPPAAFIELFHSVDAVLLPYDVSIYGTQGSGIVQDAVADRKLLVYSRGMSMGELLGHGNARDAQTDQEFAAAIVDLSELPAARKVDATRRALECLREIHAGHPLLRAFDAS